PNFQQLTAHHLFNDSIAPAFVSLLKSVVAFFPDGIDYFQLFLIQIPRQIIGSEAKLLFGIEIKARRQRRLYGFAPAAVVEAVHPPAKLQHLRREHRLFIQDLFYRPCIKVRLLLVHLYNEANGFMAAQRHPRAFTGSSLLLQAFRQFVSKKPADSRSESNISVDRQVEWLVKFGMNCCTESIFILRMGINSSGTIYEINSMPCGLGTLPVGV